MAKACADVGQENHHGMNGGGKSWFDLAAIEINPVYIISLIAASAITFYQVTELVSDVKELTGVKNEMSRQVVILTTRNEEFNKIMANEVSYLVTAINKNSKSLEKTAEETRQRLRKLEHILARLTMPHEG